MFETDPDYDFGDKPAIPQSSPFKRPTTNWGPNGATSIKRKFPGPAGLLPYNDSSILDASTETPDEIPWSQRSMGAFQTGPWLKMTRDYSSHAAKYTIKWIKSRALSDRLVDRKAPFLAALIQHIECCDGKHPTVNVTLRDATGEIQGTILYSLYEEYAERLKVGAGIILRQCGVLTTGLNNHLTITGNNLVAIYVINGNETEMVQIRGAGAEPHLRERELLETLQALQGDEGGDSKEVTISCSQMSVRADERDSEIWKSALEGLDADSLFDDF